MICLSLVLEEGLLRKMVQLNLIIFHQMPFIGFYESKTPNTSATVQLWARLGSRTAGEKPKPFPGVGAISTWGHIQPFGQHPRF
jgi:hypothetical protein